jgi:hypothetical protein
VDDIETIKQLKARYFRSMDTKDWDGMRQVFADDIELDSSESGGVLLSGADDVIAFLRSALDGVVTVHHGHMPEIEITSRTTATGIWAMEDMLRWPDGRELHGYGHYLEAYTKADDVWRISASKLTRLRQDITEPGGVS